MSKYRTLQDDALALLKELIATPSFSKEEDQTAGVICRFLGLHRIEHVIDRDESEQPDREPLHAGVGRGQFDVS